MANKTNHRQKAIGVLDMKLSPSIRSMTSSPRVRFDVRVGSGASPTAASPTVELTATVAATCNAVTATSPPPNGNSLGPPGRSSCIFCCSVKHPCRGMLLLKSLFFLLLLRVRPTLCQPLLADDELPVRDSLRASGNREVCNPLPRLQKSAE